MRVILLQDIKGLGKKFDIKEVKEGYGRNFLIARGLAQLATEGEVRKLRSEKTAEAQGKSILIARLKDISKNIQNTSLIFSLKTGKKGEIFGSVNSEDIRQKLCETFPELEKTNIEVALPRPIKKVGDYDVIIKLGEEIEAKAKVIISSDTS